MTVDSGVNGTVSNQATATAVGLPLAGVATDNVDNATPGLPAGVVVSAGSIPQTQNPSIDLTIVAIPGVSVSGTVYRDQQPNGTRDGGETGTGLTLYVKLSGRTGSSCNGPALAAVSTDPTTGAYGVTGSRPGTIACSSMTTRPSAMSPRPSRRVGCTPVRAAGPAHHHHHHRPHIARLRPLRGRRAQRPRISRYGRGRCSQRRSAERLRARDRWGDGEAHRRIRQHTPPR